jgi:hypothetical protein
VSAGDDADPLRGSDARFARRRLELAAELRALLGAHEAAEPLADAGRAAAIAADVGAAHREARPHPWALVRHAWPAGERGAVVALLHAVSARVGPRPAWLVVPGREPQVVALGSDLVLDNPLGFAALAGGELVLGDQAVPAGLWLHAGGDGWELEAWGAEPWLSATTRAIREAG